MLIVKPPPNPKQIPHRRETDVVQAPDGHGASGCGSVTLVGAGGNIGSHLAPHLARMPGVGRVVLVDPDTYEPKNVRSQDVLPADVGLPKVDVQRSRIERINPALGVRTFDAFVEDVPMGLLRADVIIAAVDSRIARQSINEIASRLGATWIDTGVDAAGLLARVNVYEPGMDVPCLECAWDQIDYDALETSYPCLPGRDRVAATNAPSWLGALAASLAAGECEKLLNGNTDDVLVSRQVYIDARHHRHYVTGYRRNPACRFDHQTWEINPLEIDVEQATLGELADQFCNGRSEITLQLERHAFTRSLLCSRGCEVDFDGIVIADRLPVPLRNCPHCGEELTSPGFERFERVQLAALTESESRLQLSEIGLQPGDVVTVTAQKALSHYELIRK